MQEADFLTLHYSTDDSISRARKLKFFWEEVLRHQQEEAKFSYLLDCVEYFNPVAEYTDQIIQAFQQPNPEKIRLKFLYALFEAINCETQSFVKPQPITPELKRLAEFNLPRVRDIFRDILYHEPESTLLEDAIFLYSAFDTPQRSYQIITETLHRQDLSAQFKEKMQLKYFYGSQGIGLVFSSPVMQQEYLPSLLEKVKAASKQQRDAFNSTLIFRIVESSKPIDPAQLNDAVRPALQAYIDSQKPQSKPTLEELSWPAPFVNSPGVRYYKWMVADIFVKSHSQQEKNRRVADAILKEPDLFYQSFLILIAAKEVGNCMPNSQLAAIKDRINHRLKENSLKSNKNSDMERRILRYGYDYILSRIPDKPDESSG